MGDKELEQEPNDTTRFYNKDIFCRFSDTRLQAF